MTPRIWTVLGILLFSPGRARAEGRDDIRPPVDLPPDFLWLYFLAGFLAVGFFIAGILWFWKKHWASRPVPVIPPRSPWEIADEQLTILQREALPGKGLIKEYFVRLSGIIRGYIEGRFRINAPEMTTEEFLNHLKTAAELNAAQKKSLTEFLEICDLVKFAKYAASLQETEDAFRIARSMVDETRPAEISPAAPEGPPHR